MDRIKLAETLAQHQFQENHDVAATITAPFASQPAPSSLHPTANLEFGQQLEMSEELGTGGMGVVYLAKQNSLRRDVAVKQLREQISDPLMVQNLLQEATVTGCLEHPNIVPVHWVERDHRGFPRMVMKRIAGVSWKTLIYQPDHPFYKTIQDDRSTWHLTVLLQVCNAIHFAHSRGIIHRDIKTENVMIGEFGEVYVVDWGVAMFRNAPPNQHIVGTPMFLAPEMLQGWGPHITERTDVYLLGTTLHEVLTQQPRHQGSTVPEVMFNALESLPYEYPATISRELATICNRATSVQSEDRYASVLEFRKAIAEYLQHKGSIQLTEEALILSREFQQSLQQALESQNTADVVEINRIFNECRFGLRQALKLWPDNPNAHRILKQAQEMMFDFHIRHKDIAAASALHSEMKSPAPALATQLAQLQSSVEQEQQRIRFLEGFEWENDLSVGRKFRGYIAMGNGVIFGLILMVLGVLVRQRVIAFTITSTLITFSAFASLLVVGIFALRKDVLVNRVNRSLAISLVAAIIGAIFSVIFANIFHWSAAGAVVQAYMIVAVSGLILGAIFQPAIMLSGCIFVLGALFSAIFPEQLIFIGSLTVFASHFTLGYFWLRNTPVPSDSNPIVSTQISAKSPHN